MELNPTMLVMAVTEIAGSLAYLQNDFDEVLAAMAAGKYSMEGWVDVVGLEGWVDVVGLEGWVDVVGLEGWSMRSPTCARVAA